MIWYSRPDQPGPKRSDYTRTPLDDPPAVRRTLAGALGVLVVVEKRREVLLVDNVRIHLDKVAGLGELLEFEAVVTDRVDLAAAREQVESLRADFGISPSDWLDGSYSDLLIPRELLTAGCRSTGRRSVVNLRGKDRPGNSFSMLTAFTLPSPRGRGVCG